MLQLYGHPFSSCTWKVLIALYETGLAFDFRLLDADHPDHGTAFAALAPLGKFPLLVDDGLVFEESSIIIEHLALRHAPEAELIPLGDEDALDVRAIDRVCDHYVMTPMQQIVGDALRPPAARDGQSVADAKAMLDKAYRWLEARLEPEQWASGWGFTLADCSAAPALFYADWVHPITDQFAVLKRYRAKLLARASVARVVDEARPYRAYFPLGAPDRD
jgi:glutathione S-transferase